MTTTYIAGCNRPGHLPDMDPLAFPTFDEAKRYVIELLLNSADNFGQQDDHEIADDLDNLAQDVNLESRPFTVIAPDPDGYAYWVHEEEA